MKRVVSLDPGQTTGWAAWTDYEDKSVSQFTCGQIGPQEHHKALFDMLGMLHTSEYAIVCERFEYRNRSRPGLELISREYIGVTRLFVQERSDVHLEMQSASQAKGFVTDAHIKKLGLWSPGDRHAMDAYRHLLYFLINGTTLPIKTELLKAAWK